MDFRYINSNILDNLFYILVSLLAFYVLLNHIGRLTTYKKSLITMCASVPIILCMSFPIYIDKYCIHDFRQIPFVIGILYGGWPVGTALLIILLIVRSVMYGFNALTVVVYAAIFILTALFSKKFNTLSRKNKLLSLIPFFVLLESLTTFIALTMSNNFKVTEAYVFYFIIFPPFLLFFVVYVIEILREAIHIRSRVVKLEKMEVVSQLAASISHEVRNPLTVVKGFTQLLKDPDISQEVREQYIEHIFRETGRAESIINEYLAFAKSGIEKVENIQVEHQIRNVIEILKPLASMSSVNILDQLSPATIRGNIQYFQQCFVNLLKNGIEAMPDGGELSVVSLVDGTNVVIEIRDNGIGMSKEQVNRFGEPYYSSKEKGTGLGSMVIVRTIQLMNGRIHIQSTPSEGTTITITFPRK